MTISLCTPCTYEHEEVVAEVNLAMANSYQITQELIESYEFGQTKNTIELR